MRESLPTRLLLMLAEATPAKLAAVERFLAGQPLPDRERRARRSRPQPAPGDRSSPTGAPAGSAWVFRRSGRRHWEVILGGGRPFHMENTLGARYLNYWLHHPNEPISAFELEVLIQPEKGEARSRDSIQRETDPRARREYREALRRLQAEREGARAGDDPEEVQRREGQIEALEAALKPGDVGADAGERARVNVRKAVTAVLAELRKGGPEEKAFADHLERHLSTGYECLYSQPEGKIWS